MWDLPHQAKFWNMNAHSDITIQETFMCRAGLGERVIALLEERMCVVCTEHTMKNVWSQP